MYDQKHVFEMVRPRWHQRKASRRTARQGSIQEGLSARLAGDAVHQQMRVFLKYWLCGTGGVPVSFTPLGRSWDSNDGSLGTTANAAFMAAVYGELVP